MTDIENCEMYVDYETLCIEQTKFLANILHKKDNYKTSADIYKKAHLQLEKYIKKGELINYDTGSYLPVKVNNDWKELIKLLVLMEQEELTWIKVYEVLYQYCTNETQVEVPKESSSGKEADNSESEEIYNTSKRSMRFVGKSR